MRFLSIIPARARLWAVWAAAVALVLAALAAVPRRAEPVALSASNIALFQRDPGLCRAVLAEAGHEVEALPDLAGARGCGYRDAVKLSRATYSAPLGASCATAAALLLWERDVAAPAARRRYGQDLARIEFAAPAYQCRRIAGRSDGRLSEHASANAIDIQGFTLAEGRTVSVAEGWRGSRRDRAFLREVRDGACAHFRAVLSPDYNRAHRDHLHFDLGRDDMCR
jgi:hypothetical protein